MEDHQEHKNTTAGQAANICSPEIIRCGFHPEHRYVIENAGGHGLSVSECGDSTEFFVQIADGIVEEVSFVTSGCFGQVASAEKLCEMAGGQTIATVLSITAEQIDEELGHLPEEVAHCLQESCETLAQAIRDYLTNRQAPWKQIYG